MMQQPHNSVSSVNHAAVVVTYWWVDGHISCKVKQQKSCTKSVGLETALNASKF